MKTNIFKRLTLFAAAFAFCAVLTAKPIDAEAAVAPTNLTQTAASTTSVKVEWSSDVTVKYYEVQVSNSGVESTYTSKSKYASNSYTIYSLNAGSTYYVRVRGYNSASDVSPWVNLKVDTSPNNITTLTQTSAAQNKVTVTWNAVAGATGYMVYKALPSDSSYTKVGAVTGTSYTLSVPNNTKYEIAVLPYRNVANPSVLVPYNTNYPKSVYCVPAPTKPNSLNIASRYYSSNATKFTWNPTSDTSNTDGYQLQIYYINKNGKTKKLTTKTTTSCYTDYVTVNASKLFSYAFKYRVRSYVTINNKKYYSGWTSYKTYVPGAVAKKIYRSSYRATSGTLKWSKVVGAKSYTVYWKAAADDNWKAVAKNVKGTSATVKYSPSASYNYYYIKANKVKVGNSRKNSTASSKILDAYRTY